jgi:hypothetical protein
MTSVYLLPKSLDAKVTSLRLHVLWLSHSPPRGASGIYRRTEKICEVASPCLGTMES